jgi:hypothetical protein
MIKCVERKSRTVGAVSIGIKFSAHYFPLSIYVAFCQLLLL